MTMQKLEILDNVLDCLVDYDMENKKWFSRLADFEIETDEKNDTLTVHYTIKEGIVWSYYNSDKKLCSCTVKGKNGSVVGDVERFWLGTEYK